MNYDESIQYLYDRLPVFYRVGSQAYKPGLDNTIRLLNALDNPQTHFRSIHVAGTNGKGSVSHMLAAVLQYAGYKVGLYTSPHLVDFRERIRINGEMIDKQVVVDFVENNKLLFNEVQPSFFEATMAMAFQYFADCKVDIAIIEVGLGGRLDSTNVILPELSVITNISFDHVGFLGNTLEKIAYEKAGIIKEYVPVVIGEALPETRPVFESKAKEVDASIVFVEDVKRMIFKEYVGNKMVVESTDKELFTIGLCGNYQLKNIATTIVAVEQIRKSGFQISNSDLRKGLENVCELTGLKGRWQLLSKNPTMVADTGHNEAGIRYVVEQLNHQTYSRLRIVFGAVNDKDVTTILSLLPKDAVYYFTQAQIPRALPAEELKTKAESEGLSGMVYPTVKQAIESVISEASTTDFIFIGGSNFIVGEALIELENLKII